MTNTKSINRFWSKVRKTRRCWEWTGAKTHGYGNLRLNYKSTRAHRLSWELTYGEIPEGASVLHKCDNPGCVRPNHLFIGTQQDNIRDAYKKGRMVDNSGEKGGMSKLTENKINTIRKMYAVGNISQKVLGRLFGVGQYQISRIVNKLRWKHI